jgi:hypothetical protein
VNRPSFGAGTVIRAFEKLNVTIRYILRRADVWRAYWHQWRSSWKLKAAQAVIAVSVFYVVLTTLAGAKPVRAHHFLWAAVAAFGVLAILPIYPLIRLKRHERTLTITIEGISTTIGKRHGEIPWSKIESVASEAERIYIVGKNQNSFTIPDRAFASAQARDIFLTTAQRWLETSRKR